MASFSSAQQCAALSILTLFYAIRRRAALRFPRVAEITQLIVYPIKACAGISVDRVEVTKLGLEHDRQWMVVKAEDYSFVCQRAHPILATVHVTLNKTHVTATHPRSRHSAHLLLSPPDYSKFKSVEVRVWSSKVQALDEGEEAATFFSEVLGMPVRVVRFGPDSRRPTNRFPEEQVAFADGYPVLVASEASLCDLNERLAANQGQGVPMNRFRPNVVLRGLAPWMEDYEFTLHCGQSVLRACKPCDRCKVPTVDQRSGVPDKAEEPTKTLRTFRKLFPNDVNVYVRCLGPRPPALGAPS
jgi:uncharacterized protein YcbX